MFDFFQNIFGKVISLMASAIIAVGLVSVQEAPKNALQIEQIEEKLAEKATISVEQNEKQIKVPIAENKIQEQPENVVQNNLPKPIISETKERRKIRGDMEDVKKREIQTLLQEFMDDPTSESFLRLCGKANQVEIPSTGKTILSPDRTTTMTIPYTMFDIMKCELIINQHYSLINIMPELFQWETKDDDSDTLRIRKIEYDKRIRAILTLGKFVIVEKALIPSINNLTGHLITEGENYVFSFWIYNPTIRAAGLLKDPNSTRLLKNGDLSFFGETLSAVVTSP